ncbi:hypothetical protein MASR1M97_06300 [Candidatus Desulfobacillus denitrificans]
MQAEAAAAATQLGRKKGIEHALQILLGYAYAVVQEFDAHLPRASPPGPQTHDALLAAFEGMGKRVGNKIRYHLA